MLFISTVGRKTGLRHDRISQTRGLSTGILLRLVGRAPEVAVDNALSQGSHLSRRNPCPTNRSHLYELGYLPIDKHGADLLFQIISQRYERASMVITANRVYKHWAQIFNNDSTLTSAILDRVLHHADTVIIDGKSFRMKDSSEQ